MIDLNNDVDRLVAAIRSLERTVARAALAGQVTIACQVCTVYEGTCGVEVGKLVVVLCRACLPRVRAALKDEYKRVEAEWSASREVQRTAGLEGRDG